MSTGRLHGFESLAEARLLLALDFAADLVDVASQPFRLRFSTADGVREHIPDFLADTTNGGWLIDVRPAARVTADDCVGFAAAAEIALVAGWRYVVIGGWKRHIWTTLDTLSAQRRPGSRMTPQRTTQNRTAPMAEGRRADSARRRQRVIKALNDASNAGEEITVSAIARKAGVDRTFFYRHRDLLAQLHLLEAQPPAAPGTAPTVSKSSLQADVANAQARSARLDARVRQLEKKLSEVLGEQAWRESGLGAPDDVEQLKHQITTLEQQVFDLRLRLEERDEELDAARAANRELMARLNSASR